MRHFARDTKCRMKEKSPYFTSAAARNSHLNNKPEADGALNFPPIIPPTVFLHHYSVLRVSKAVSSYTERKEIERNT